MKRLFAITLTIALMLSSFTALSGAANKDTQNQNLEPQASFLVSAQTEDTSEVQDGKLTLDMIRQMPSWKVLVSTAVPIGSYKNIKNAEDQYSVMLIEGLNHRLVIPVYHDLEYVSLALGGIRLNDINYDRLMCKFRAIIDVYNASNDLQLTWTPEILNENYMQVHVKSTNVIPVITEVGQVGVLRQGATYWESSWNDGSGKYGVATAGNCSIPEDFVVTVNGFAYLDESRTNVVKSYYKPYEELGKEKVQIFPWEYRMLHICTASGDLGWVYAEDVARLDANCK